MQKAVDSASCVLLATHRGAPGKNLLAGPKSTAGVLTPVPETREKTPELPKAELALNPGLLSLPFFLCDRDYLAMISKVLLVCALVLL